jgi:heme/copper-type cytochrome/quinol oxidase subunit 2
MFLSELLKENQNKGIKINSNQNIIRNSPIPILPISFSILFLIIVFTSTPVYCQKKEPAKPTDKSAVSTSQTQESPQTYNNSIPTNFDINAVSAEVRKQLEENKKNRRPFFEGISLALEFELMDDIVSESELFERIQKSAEGKMPIQIKKKAESVYWIFTDTNTSTAYTKEIFSAAGIKVNFISRSYQLK